MSACCTTGPVLFVSASIYDCIVYCRLLCSVLTFVPNIGRFLYAFAYAQRQSRPLTFFLTFNSHAGYCCPGERLEQFCFLRLFVFELGAVQDRQTHRQTDGQAKHVTRPV